MEPRKINAMITITATYDNAVNISLHDKDSGITFIEMKLTREQFINAAMNRLAMTHVENAEVRDLDKVGKRLVLDTIKVEIPKYGDEKSAIELVQKNCPEGYVPDLYFKSRESFSQDNGKYYAQTRIRKWVDM